MDLPENLLEVEAILEIEMDQEIDRGDRHQEIEKAETKDHHGNPGQDHDHHLPIEKREAKEMRQRRQMNL